MFCRTIPTLYTRIELYNSNRIIKIIIIEEILWLLAYIYGEEKLRHLWGFLCFYFVMLSILCCKKSISFYGYINENLILLNNI